jgi:hypothetical protein
MPFPSFRLGGTLTLAILLSCVASSAQTSSTQARPPYDGQAESKNGSSQGIEILSDTLGVDFRPYIAKILPVVKKSRDQALLKESPSITSAITVQIRASILPSGRLESKSMVLLSRSGNVALDRASWSAVETSVYPSLPAEFKGPRLMVRFTFLYNIKTAPAEASPAK